MLDLSNWTVSISAWYSLANERLEFSSLYRQTHLPVYNLSKCIFILWVESICALLTQSTALRLEDLRG